MPPMEQRRHMIKNIKRREAIKVATIAAGGLLASKGLASESNIFHRGSFAGSWLYQGQPCAIFQQGAVLLVVNEAGSLATAQVTGPNAFVIVGGSGWDIGLVAEVVNRGTRINWSNNTVWEQS